jgi:hypothetical protein
LLDQSRDRRVAGGSLQREDAPGRAAGAARLARDGGPRRARRGQRGGARRYGHLDGLLAPGLTQAHEIFAALARRTVSAVQVPMLGKANAPVDGAATGSDAMFAASASIQRRMAGDATTGLRAA